MSSGTIGDIKLPLRIGVVGTGFGQQVHIPAFRTDSRCTVTAVCNSTPERAQKIASILNIEKYFGGWTQLVDDEEIDAISIAVPPYLQEEIALAAIQAGKHIFCEKPLSTSVKTAQLIVENALKANVANLIDFEFPEIPQWQMAKKYLDTDQLGSLHYVYITWHVETYANRKKLSSWKTNSQQGGGVLNSFVSHCFYYIEWMLGPIKSLCSTLSKSPLDQRDGDTTALMHLVLKSGVTISLNVCSSAALGSGHRLEFYGDKATMVLHNKTSDYVSGFELLLGDHQSMNLASIHTDDWVSKDEDGRVKAVSRLTHRFIDWIMDGSAQNPSLAAGLRVQQLIEATKQSNQKQHWIVI